VDRFLKVFPIVKVDIAQRMIYGLVTAEREDKDGETCHYDSTVPEYKAFNDEMSKMSDGQNIMPLREMHQLHAVGAGKSIDFDDAKKEIRLGFKVIEESTWQKVQEKVLLAFSQGGSYIKRWTEGKTRFYTARPGETSLVDNPCLTGAVIEYVKADGSIERYKIPDPPLARLTEADVQSIGKALADSILGTQAEKIDAAIVERMRQLNAAKGEDMNKDQIVKCAAALGITVEEFTKQFVEGDALGKGAKGMAAVHSHLETLSEHHGEMGKLHKSMGSLHDKMGSHIEKCMKAASDVMGSEGEKGEKAFKALLDELKAAAATPDEMVSIGKTADGVEVFRKKTDKEVKLEDLSKGVSMKPEEVNKLIADALAKQATEFDEKLSKTLAPNNGGTGAQITQLIGRDGKVIEKAATSDARNPMALD
jgi:hypothetical protein